MIDILMVYLRWSGNVVLFLLFLSSGQRNFRIDDIKITTARTSVILIHTPPLTDRCVFMEIQIHPLTFRHRASCILGQAFHCSPEKAFYIFNQQIYFII